MKALQNVFSLILAQSMKNQPKKWALGDGLNCLKANMDLFDEGVVINVKEYPVAGGYRITVDHYPDTSDAAPTQTWYNVVSPVFDEQFKVLYRNLLDSELDRQFEKTGKIPSNSNVEEVGKWALRRFGSGDSNSFASGSFSS